MRKAATAVLPGTFGWSALGINLWIEHVRKKKSALTIHISNGPGRRTKMHRGDFAAGYSIRQFDEALQSRQPKLMRLIESRIKKIQSKIDWMRMDRLFLCPELEDNLSNAAFKNFAAEVKKHWPEGKIVRNPCTNGMAGGRYKEVHGYPAVTYPKNTLFNPDGISVELGDLDRYFKKKSYAETQRYFQRYANNTMVLVWPAPVQGLQNCTGWGAQGVPPPKQRTFIVTDQAIRKIPALLNTPGTAFFGVSAFSIMSKRFPIQRFLQLYPV